VTPAQHMDTLFVVLAFTGLLYFIAAFALLIYRISELFGDPKPEPFDPADLLEAPLVDEPTPVSSHYEVYLPSGRISFSSEGAFLVEKTDADYVHPTRPERRKPPQGGSHGKRRKR